MVMVMIQEGIYHKLRYELTKVYVEKKSLKLFYCWSLQFADENQLHAIYTFSDYI